ncbi:hypothetical protein D7X12_26020 [Corallococcus sicarius]|uniref:Uncharacterized protein n=1 Tax=Corallococcus sicarius TaxID=2316726 RepID=A0A3A8N256_9BACT|nr:hypothetical protein D7X12_26020 [Corallococcus sicarius]
MDLGGGLIGPVYERGTQTFVASDGANGAHRWSRNVGPNLSQPLVGITPDGGPFFGGTLKGYTSVGPVQYGHPQGSDLLLLKFAP